MKLLYIFRNSRARYSSIIFSLGFLFLCFISPMFGQIGIGIKIGGMGGNPLPEFCEEPCNTQLRRWFKIDVSNSSATTLRLDGFDLDNFHFHKTMIPGQALDTPTKTFVIDEWNLVDAQGLYPNGTPGVYGATVEGSFHDFPVMIPAGEVATIVVEIFMIGCVSDADGFPVKMPAGHYSMDFELDTGETDVGIYKMIPASSCNADGIANPEKAVVSILASPNPFFNTANFSIILAEEGVGSLSLYNIQGQKVIQLINGELLSAGQNDLSFNLSGISPGIYLAKLETSLGVKTMRVLRK